MKELADQIASRLKEQGAIVSAQEIEARLRLLIENFRVPEAEARRSVMNYFLKENGIAPKPFSRGSEPAKIADIDSLGRWVDLRVKVVQIWEPGSEAIAQAGLLADETGAIKFVKWAKAGLPPLVEGKSYLLKNVVTDEFQGRFSIKMNRTSVIVELDLPVEVKDEVIAPQEEVKIAEITQAGRWVDLRVKVVQIWEPGSEAVSQAGLVGDDSGVMKFVKWAKAGLPPLVEGKSYLLKNIVTDEFQGRFSIKMNRTSEIVSLDDEIEVGSQVAEFSGVVVDIQKGSGLIKRCPTCRRSLSKGMCVDHGKVEGTYDLRIKAALDDGKQVQDILLNRERTEDLIDLSLDEARKMAMEALDHEVIRGIIEEKLLGRYFNAIGPRIDRYILVERIDRMPPVSLSEVDEVVSKLEVV